MNCFFDLPKRLLLNTVFKYCRKISTNLSCRRRRHLGVATKILHYVQDDSIKSTLFANSTYFCPIIQQNEKAEIHTV